MLKDIAEVSTINGFTLFANMALDEVCSSYVDLDDYQFLRSLRQSDIEAISSRAKSLCDRKLWKRVAAFEDVKRIEDAFQVLERDVPEARLQKDIQSVKATKDLHGGALLLSQDQNGIYSANSFSDWTVQSLILKALNEKETRLSRIYLKNPSKGVRKNIRISQQTAMGEAIS